METGRDFLRGQLDHSDSRVRAASLTALIDAGDRKLDLAALAEKEPLRRSALWPCAPWPSAARTRASVPRRQVPPAVRLEAIASLKGDVGRAATAASCWPMLIRSSATLLCGNWDGSRICSAGSMCIR